MCKQRKLLAVCSGLGLLSLFLPWVSLGFYSLSAFDITKFSSFPFGLINLLFMGGILVLSFIGDKTVPLKGKSVILPGVGGFVALATAIGFLVKFSSQMSKAASSGGGRMAKAFVKAMSAGFGVYVLIAAAVGLFVVLFAVKEQESAASINSNEE